MENGDNLYRVERGDAPGYDPAGRGSVENVEHNPGPVKNGILDIIYGVLFDPARAFAGIAHNPPVGAAVVIYISLNLLEALTGLFITPQYFREMHVPGMMGVDFIRHMALLVAAGGFILGIIKWFVMAGLLHLLAELFGGKGSARGVFAVYGVAGLPAVFMIPVNVLLFYLAAGFTRTLIATLLGLGVFAWSTVLLINGLREVHRFGAGRAVLTVLSPVLALVTIMVLLMIIVGIVVSTLPVDPYIKIF